MAVNTKKRFTSINSEDLKKMWTEKDSKITKQSTETTVKLIKAYFQEKELPENFEAELTASTLKNQLTRFFAEMRQRFFVFFLLCWGLMTHQPLWVILCCLPEKGRKEKQKRWKWGTGKKEEWEWEWRKTEEIKTSPPHLYFYLHKDSRPCPPVSQYQLNTPL